jgi:hypothetical protein
MMPWFRQGIERREFVLDEYEYTLLYKGTTASHTRSTENVH